jgi:hypothetical protein
VLLIWIITPGSLTPFVITSKFLTEYYGITPLKLARYAGPVVADAEDGLQERRVAANILNWQ